MVCSGTTLLMGFVTCGVCCLWSLSLAGFVACRVCRSIASSYPLLMAAGNIYCNDSDEGWDDVWVMIVMFAVIKQAVMMHGETDDEVDDGGDKGSDDGGETDDEGDMASDDRE